MKLTHENLITLISEALDTDQKGAEKELKNWIHKVQAEVSEKGRYHINGLGVFQLVNDALVFEPEKELQIEVNYKYAGMEPIEIHPAASAGSQDEGQSLQPGSSEGPVEESKEEHYSDAEEEKQEHYSDPFDLDESPDDPRKQFDEFKRKFEKTEEEIGEEKKSGQHSQKASEDEEAKQEQHKIPDQTALRRKREAYSRKRRKEPESKLWLLPIAAAVIVAILLFFHYRGQILDQRHQAGQSQTEELETADREGTAAEPSEHQVQPAVEEETPSYGLRGPVEEIAQGAYTIVLHSLSNEERAREQRDIFKDQGYKAILFEATAPDGGRTWRVGVGQFESVEQAQEAISNLPGRYRDNNFIIRIR